MFGLYMLAIYLGIAIIVTGFVALLVVVALAVGLVTHPIRTIALVFHKLAALVVWFWTDHAKPDFVPCFWGSIGVIVASVIIRAFAEWVLERPTRAERRAMSRAAAPRSIRACRIYFLKRRVTKVLGAIWAIRPKARGHEMRIREKGSGVMFGIEAISEFEMRRRAENFSAPPAPPC